MRVRSYEIAAGGFPGGITIALVTDVHQRQPEEALAALKAMRPDMICMAGDILERNDNGMDPREGMEEAAPYARSMPASAGGEGGKTAKTPSVFSGRRESWRRYL